MIGSGTATAASTAAMRSKRLGVNPLPKQPYQQLGSVTVQNDDKQNEEIEQAGDDPLLNLQMMPLQKMTSDPLSTPAQEEALELPTGQPSETSEF